MSGRARAARLHTHGQPLVVEEVDLPDPGPGQVVVDMAYAGVNPVDRYVALGRVAPDAPLPRTVGSEGAGTVAGRRVLVRGGGAFATAALATESSLIDIPPDVGLDIAAAIGVAGVTAFRCVTELAAVTSGDRVLVLGASGGVGSMIVSLAHYVGATVWAQTSSPEKSAFLSGLGADHVVSSGPESLAGELGDLRPTVVFDPLGDGYTAAAVEVLEPRGRIILFGASADPSGTLPLLAFYRKSLRMLGYGGLGETEEVLAAGIRATLTAVSEGRLVVSIDSILPLDEVNDAFDRLANRSLRGKVLLDLGG